MYCKYCGNPIRDNENYCHYCKKTIDNNKVADSKDYSNFGFAVLGFLIPLLGLIVFLVYEKKEPQKARSTVKGVLVGFITKIIIIIVIFVVTIVFSYLIIDNTENEVSFNTTTDNISEEYQQQSFAEVTFGDFTVSSNGYLPKTSLDVTVKNKANTKYTFFITIEATDSSGARLDTDSIYADTLNPNQEIHLTAFEYIDKEKLEQFKNANFKVLEINQYNH